MESVQRKEKFLRVSEASGQLSDPMTCELGKKNEVSAGERCTEEPDHVGP